MATLAEEYVSFGGEWISVPGGGGAPIVTDSPNYLEMNVNLPSFNDWGTFNQAGVSMGPPKIAYDQNGGYYIQFPSPNMLQNFGFGSVTDSMAAFDDALSVQVEVEVCLIISPAPMNGATGDMGIAIEVNDPTPITGGVKYTQTLFVTPSPTGEFGTWHTVLFDPFPMSSLVNNKANTEVLLKNNGGIGDVTNLNTYRLRKVRWLDAATGALIATF